MQSYRLKNRTIRPRLFITEWVVLLLIDSVWGIPPVVLGVVVTLLGILTLLVLISVLYEAHLGSGTIDLEDVYNLINKK